MLKDIKLVIFDLDGTLVDAYPAIVRSFNLTMRKLNLPTQKSTVIHRAVGWGDKNLLKPFVGDKNISMALRIYRKDHKTSLRQKTKFLPHAKDLLAYLKKKKYRLAIASNRPTKFTHIILEHLKVKDWFDYILCGDKMKRSKPHPDILLKTLNRFSLRPQEAVYVGDMTVDVLAGKRAKIKTIAVATGSNTKKELQKLKPFRLIDHVGELKKILDGAAG
ncbi:MAG: HAD family hydrolase [Candidatus Omnitrophota bacterium]